MNKNSTRASVIYDVHTRHGDGSPLGALAYAYRLPDPRALASYQHEPRVALGLIAGLLRDRLALLYDGEWEVHQMDDLGRLRLTGDLDAWRRLLWPRIRPQDKFPDTQVLGELYGEKIAGRIKRREREEARKQATP